MATELSLGLTFSILVGVLTLGYAACVLRLLRGLSRLSCGKPTGQPPVSVIIPVRNEEPTIARCLNSLLRQDYPTEKMEIIVVDDQSTDRTASIVEAYARNGNAVRLLRLQDDGASISPKKRALLEGLQVSHHPVILTIDGDCYAPPGWVRSLISHYDEHTGVVAGFVTHAREAEKNLFHRLQSLDFLGLVTAGAGLFGLGSPVIANGANFSYRRIVFEEVGGFKGTTHLVSGDDDLFLQKVHKQTSWKICFCADAAAIVCTAPAETWRDFFHQRLRWASKALHYPSRSLRFTLLAAYAYYLLLAFGLFLSIAFPRWMPLVLGCLGIKLSVDFALLSRGSRLVGRQDLLPLLPLAEVFHVSYILAVGVASLFWPIRWKGRTFWRSYVRRAP